jgi:hypothetical protein
MQFWLATTCKQYVIYLPQLAEHACPGSLAIGAQRRGSHCDWASDALRSIFDLNYQSVADGMALATFLPGSAGHGDQFNSTV